MVKNESEGAIGKDSQPDERDGFIDENGQNGEEIGTEKDSVDGEIIVYSRPQEGIKRGEDGRFLPGSRPPVKRRQDEQALLRALDSTLPPERCSELIEKALAWAEEWKSAKTVLAVLQFRYSYTVGMPVQRSVTATTRLETLLNRIGEMDDAEFAEGEQQMRSE